MMIDGNRSVAVMNRQAAKLLDLPEHFLGARPTFDEVINVLWMNGEFGRDGELLEPAVREAIKTRALVPPIAVYERTRPNGAVVEIRSQALPDGGVVKTITDISERKRSEAHIVHIARHDALTDLPNRVLLRDEMEKAHARLARHDERFALFLLDLDRFKAVNDTLGHPAGDRLLQAVAERLRASVRETDTVARLGGDEFAILQHAPRRREKVAALAERLLRVIGASYDLDGHQAVVTVSIGITYANDPQVDVEQLFRNADLALYRVKSDGRNGYQFFRTEMDVEAQARRRFELDLQNGIDRGDFELHYQPIFNLASKEIVSVEALVRWRHPQRGLVPPADFVSVAEEIGLIAALGDWVLRTACAEAMNWPAKVKVAVNLSPTQFNRTDVAGAVRAALQNSGLPPQRLELEITETLLLREAEGNLSILHDLRRLGARIALDDFGTGYSSLSYLRAFPFDKIKIDRSFVTELSSRPDCAAIVNAIASLGRTLGVATTAEGVETREQLELLRAAGCTEAQGYLFKRALPAAELAELLTGSVSLDEVA
jgi:diguanylate cyclase (GGDEF)-like protein